MRKLQLIYFAIMASILLSAFSVSRVESAEFYLDPDTVFLTGSVGTDVTLELRVDGTMQNLKIYQIKFQFDPTKLDTSTLTVTQGPLLPSSGNQTAFHWYLDANDSVLTIEDLILGPGVAVDGPGVLASLTMRTIDTGCVDLSVLDHRARDIVGDSLPSTASGAILYLDFPPLPFNLLTPTPNGMVYGTACPGDSITFTWETSHSVYVMESVSYDFELSAGPAFHPNETTVIGGLTDTTVRLSAEGMASGAQYWRVTAIGDIVQAPRRSSQFPSIFEFIPGTDADNDGWGEGCDCNDADSLLHPNTIWFADADGDTYGDPVVTLVQCDQPAGYVLNGMDCNDADGSLNPGTIWYEDADGDGFGHPGVQLVQCEQPPGFVLDGTDNCPAVYNPDQADSDGNGIGDVCDCSCVYQADMDQSGNVDAIDLGQIIDVIFFGGTNPQDPRCPRTRADFDSSGATDAIDLAAVIDYVFFGGTSPVDPCAP